MMDSDLDDLLLVGRVLALDDVAALDLDGSDRQLIDAIVGRGRRRRRMRAVAASVAAIAALGIVTVPTWGHGEQAVAWAATPTRLDGEMASAIDVACRAVSAAPLPAPSTVDLRGTGGVALYDLDRVWMLCTFVSDGADVAEARLTAAPVPSAWDGPTGPDIGTRISEQLTHAELGGVPVFVVTGICWDGCPGDTFRFETENGVATAVANDAGEYAAWLPAGTTYSGTWNGTP